MFLVNSRFPLVCATPSSSQRKSDHHQRALFIPKLHKNFAEFLNHSSPTRLSILYLSTCVGLGYGQPKNSLEAFLGSIGSVTSPKTARHRVSTLKGIRIYLNPGLHTYPRTNQRLGSHTFLRHSIASLLKVGQFVYPKVNSLLATMNQL